jgi:hypothetical protein
MNHPSNLKILGMLSSRFANNQANKALFSDISWSKWDISGTESRKFSAESIENEEHLAC